MDNTAQFDLCFKTNTLNQPQQDECELLASILPELMVLLQQHTEVED